MNKPPTFRGKPGEPVPEVNPEALKTVWKMSHHSPARGSTGAATGQEVLEHALPGADIDALRYRASMLSLLIHAAQSPESSIKELTSWMDEDRLKDGVLKAIAKVPMKWIGTGVVMQGFPFDIDEFVRLCKSK